MCDGPTQEFTITVNPTAQVDDQSDKVVCNTDLTTVNLTTTTRGGVANYTWVNDTPGIGRLGTGRDNISFTSTNAGT